MKAHDMNTESAANDLTQLSSREQLSALMDGALPPDQTRFLLRRLQHDAPLAECWERWRLSAEVMRGLAPAQRLPADFASRVSAALHGDVAVAQQAGSKRSPAWLRWGGGAAMAASLAVAALMTRQPVTEAPAASASVQIASASAPALEIPATPAPQAPSAPDTGNATQALATAGAIAAVSTTRPARGRNSEQARTPPRVRAAAPGIDAGTQVADANERLLASRSNIPQPDIVTRPWPRSVLPQYASGGLNVGFGDHSRGSTAYNPFQSQAGIGNLPPITATAADGDAAREPQPASAELQP
ncbi:sigma-E factor negative regulatory protein [Thermomonas sp. HDW16]|uniref:sigma-E factor negative regulatory protein n=1 Tax=Thermomonas sp. HDW16 TaxID=2714945 RepID=UPI001409EC16|nr:sigma-E factor negative regulatory protein [Thermomonas sp. HDW16]QIL20984.1 hypothetical protein G7079_09695 [Thermomonas sp. HDW16]